MRRIDGWSLQRRLLGGLLCLLALIALVFYFALATYATRAADRAFDQILLASALSMADGVQVEDGEVAVDLPYSSLAILASGRRDRIFYRVSAPDGQLVTGYAGLLESPATVAARVPRFVDGRYLDTSVRAVVLGRLVSDPDGPLVTIVVAHSRDERRALAAGIFANAFVPLLLVTLAAGALIWFAVRRALAPLATIEALVRGRGPENLEPIAAPAPAEVRQLLDTLNQFMARLKVNLALMQTFLADAAHQIRTPLATLRAQADIAIEEEDPASLPAYVRKIHRHAVQVSQVTNQLLSHTMVTHRGQVAAREPVDLLPLLRRVARRAEAGGDSPPIAIGTDGPDAAIVIGDRITLAEAFTNLIDNAGRYAGRDRPIEITLATSATRVEVDFADRGPGIPDAEKPRVLERFVRGSAGRTTAGSGLGLAIVQAVVASHDGTLALLDRPGGGLLVRLTFPRQSRERPGRVARAGALAGALALLLPASAALAQHYPALGEAAARLLIHSATDRPLIEPLLRDFQAANRDIAIDFVDMQSQEVFDSVVTPGPGGPPDLAVSSAVDLQVKLVNDGWAQRHVSPATLLLPAWANWRDETFGFTLEPAVIVYARDRLPAAEVPRSRPQLLRLLQAQPDRFRRRIATYDIGESGLGYLFASQDSILDSQFWRLAVTLGGASARLLPTSGKILDAVAAGEVLLGYNVLGSYALARQQAGAPIGISLPRDYTLWLTRTILIPRAAGNPTTAKLFVDYLLSARGQAVLAAVPGLRPILRPGSDQADFPPERAASAQPITVGPALLTFLDRMKRERFLADWNAALRPP